MKKTIVILILVVYLLSIVVVNFFGLEVKIHDGIVYVSSIKCDSITLLNGDDERINAYSYTDNGPIFIFYYTPHPENEEYSRDDLTNPNVIQLNYEILPHNADITDIQYEFEEKDTVIFNEQNGSFVFLVPGSINVTIKAVDGSHKSINVRIYCTI